MNRRLTVLIVVALSAAPVWVLPAQGDPRLEVFETPVRAQIQALVDSTRRLGLPTETLIDKALERRLKRTPSDGIVQAVRRVAATLVQAQSVLGEATDAEFDAAAAALRAGADPQTLIE